MLMGCSADDIVCLNCTHDGEMHQRTTITDIYVKKNRTDGTFTGTICATHLLSLSRRTRTAGSMVVTTGTSQCEMATHLSCCGTQMAFSGGNILKSPSNMILRCHTTIHRKRVSTFFVKARPIYGVCLSLAAALAAFCLIFLLRVLQLTCGSGRPPFSTASTLP